MRSTVCVTKRDMDNQFLSELEVSDDKFILVRGGPFLKKPEISSSSLIFEAKNPIARIKITNAA